MYKRIVLGLPLLAAACFLGLTGPAAASVKLITLPPRVRVEVQLDNPNATLVEEERLVPLSAGLNEVVFSWANANIDKESIQFRCLTDPENIKVLSVSYPPGENALTWQVASPKAISARVRISYIIGRLDRSFAYRAAASRDEKTLTLRQYIQLHNNANEEFGMDGMSAGSGERFDRPIVINETKRLLATKFTTVSIRKTYTAEFGNFGYLAPILVGSEERYADLRGQCPTSSPGGQVAYVHSRLCRAARRKWVPLREALRAWAFWENRRENAPFGPAFLTPWDGLPSDYKTAALPTELRWRRTQV